MADREEREQIRCSNPACPSRKGPGGGRIIGERGKRTGWFYLLVGKDKQGRPLEAVSLMSVTLPCPSCGHSWLNPGLGLFDGVTQVMERIAERLAESPPEHPRRRLRGDVAAA